MIKAVLGSLFVGISLVRSILVVPDPDQHPEVLSPQSELEVNVRDYPTTTETMFITSDAVGLVINPACTACLNDNTACPASFTNSKDPKKAKKWANASEYKANCNSEDLSKGEATSIPYLKLNQLERPVDKATLFWNSSKSWTNSEIHLDQSGYEFIWVNKAKNAPYIASAKKLFEDMMNDQKSNDDILNYATGTFFNDHLKPILSEILGGAELSLINAPRCFYHQKKWNDLVGRTVFKTCHYYDDQIGDEKSRLRVDHVLLQTTPASTFIEAVHKEFDIEDSDPYTLPIGDDRVNPHDDCMDTVEEDPEQTFVEVETENGRCPPARAGGLPVLHVDPWHVPAFATAYEDTVGQYIKAAPRYVPISKTAPATDPTTLDWSTVPRWREMYNAWVWLSENPCGPPLGFYTDETHTKNTGKLDRYNSGTWAPDDKENAPKLTYALQTRGDFALFRTMDVMHGSVRVEDVHKWFWNNCGTPEKRCRMSVEFRFFAALPDGQTLPGELADRDLTIYPEVAKRVAKLNEVRAQVERQRQEELEALAAKAKQAEATTKVAVAGPP